MKQTVAPLLLLGGSGVFLGNIACAGCRTTDVPDIHLRKIRSEEVRSLNAGVWKPV